MKFSPTIACLISAVTTFASPASDTTYNGFPSLLAPGAKVAQISNGYAFTEGPAADRSGNIFFTDQPNDRIWKYGIDGKFSIFMEPSGRSNGLAIDKTGNIISCADQDDQLWSIDKKAKATVLIKDYKGQKMNGPNDLWIHPSGNIYLTDPYYQRNYWERKKPDLKTQDVYLLAKGKKELSLVADSLAQPNGITGSPDGKYLYVADIRASKTYRYKINSDGTLSEKILFVSQGSDGMTVDKEGNLYLSGNGITIYDVEGKKREHIDVPAKWTGNLCFGGKDRSLLFITASEAIYTVNMKVNGVEEGMR